MDPHEVPAVELPARRTVAHTVWFRSVVGRVLLLVVATGLAAPVGSGAASTNLPGGAADRTGSTPNVVLILADDLSVREMEWMPTTRSLLARRGVTFTSAIAPHPSCCPSRAQLLTGQYAQNNGVRTNRGPDGGYAHFRPATALPVWLQRAGYQTGFVGKYLNGYPKVFEGRGNEIGWDSWDATVQRLYSYFGFSEYRNGTLVDLPDDYHTDYVTDQATQLIGHFADDTKPFFLLASYVAPHGTCAGAAEEGCASPPRPAPSYAHDYAHVIAPSLRDPSFNEADVTDKPAKVVAGGKIARATVQHLFTQRIRTLESLDDGVRRIIDALARAGTLEDTVVIFTSDNGYLFGQHRAVGKNLPYDEALRVPLTVRGPGIPAGATRHQLVAMVDLAPTIAEIADAHPLVRVDGRSVLHDMAGSGHARPRDRSLLIQAGRGSLDSGWKWRGVRTRRYTFTHWMHPGFVELYDRRRDPYELTNRAEDPRYRATLTELARRTRKLGRCSGSACRHSFGEVPGPRPPDHGSAPASTDGAFLVGRRR